MLTRIIVVSMKTDLVVAGFLVHAGKVLLIHHKKINQWIPAGGHIEGDETPDDTVIREFKEELNLDVEILNRNDIPMKGKIVRNLAMPFYVNVHNVGDHDHCCFFYLLVSKDVSKLKIKEDELIACRWFSEEELDKTDILPDVRAIAKKAFVLYKKLNDL
jgi:8-oxo-dGTP pyrophosphatase MutT (NUDIX family)